MSWNHRIMRVMSDDGNTAHYGIYEVYYDDEGNVEGWTESPTDVSAWGLTDEDYEEGIDSHHKAELGKCLYYMRRALEQPILDYKTGKEI